jgi:hypothetical protein
MVCVDAALIVASCLPFLGSDAGVLRLVRLARFLHLAGHVTDHLAHFLLRFVRAGRLLPGRWLLRPAWRWWCVSALLSEPRVRR